MSNPLCVLVVHLDGGAFVRADVVEGVPGEILVANDRLVAELVERLLHAVEVPLTLLVLEPSGLVAEQDHEEPRTLVDAAVAPSNPAGNAVRSGV